MKIIGIALMLVAVLGGGFLLSDTVGGYLESKELLARHRAAANMIQTELAPIRKDASEREIEIEIRSRERTAQLLRYDAERVDSRRNGALVVAGGTFVVFALGAFLFARGRRKRSPAGVTTVPAAVVVRRRSPAVSKPLSSGSGPA